MNTNYMTMAPGRLIKVLTNLYDTDENIKSQPTKMLWGAPGIGKSQAIQKLAKNIEKNTGKETDVIIVSLLLMNPVDLRGLPSKATNDAGQDVAKWLTPEVFQMDPDPNKIHILFLDEISAAPPSVQAAAYQIALDKRIGEHKLPDNCFVICAGNRVTDKSVAYKMPKALCNRLTHFEIVPDADDWKAWAYENNIDSRIIGFINWKPDMLHQFDPNSDDVAYPTPRSWEMVNSYLKYNNFDMVYSCIAGSIGMGTAITFRSYVELYKELITFDDIVSENVKSLPKKYEHKPDLMYAVCSVISSNMYQLDMNKNISREEKAKIFEVVAKFISTFPNKDYVAVVARDILSTCPGFRLLSLKVPAFSEINAQIAEIIYGD